ncbi:MAG: hypothetical protein HY779_02270, partial [Rubrobacteridae bacterium]|nr:hypothetical protein [Rubrobacteridae bacterium]
PVKNVFDAALRDLDYHATVFDLMQLPGNAKIIVHCGGKYGNKEQSIELFSSRFQMLPKRIKDRIAIENDEKTCGIEDIKRIHAKIGVPCVFDVFHNEVAENIGGYSSCYSNREIILSFKNTWGSLRQKIHYSNQDPKKQKGAHSESIEEHRFVDFYREIEDLELDIMLEVKDKQKSVLKLRKLIPELR